MASGSNVRAAFCAPAHFTKMKTDVRDKTQDTPRLANHQPKDSRRITDIWMWVRKFWHAMPQLARPPLRSSDACAPRAHRDESSVRAQAVMASTRLFGVDENQRHRCNPSTLRALERTLILRTLEAVDWVIGAPRGAAVKLGMRRTTLIHRMRRLGIRRPETQAAAVLQGKLRIPSPQT